MQRIINDPDVVVEDMLAGFRTAHKDFIAGTANPRVLKYAGAPVRGKVGIVTGGGSGHKPAFIGYLGRNMVDAVAVGEIFSSPTAKSFYDAFKAADGGRGIACLYGNYAGDNMNVKMAVELAEEDGLEVKTVVAKAALGGTLDEVVSAARKAIDNTRSVGIGLTPCTIPAVGKPNFTIAPGKMEVGIGHHGEPGIRIDDLRSADDMARMCVDIVLPDLPFVSGDEAVVLVSGLGATPVMELYVFYGKVAELLASKGISVYHSYVGNYFTSLEMMGVTLTVMKTDAELKELIDLDCRSMGLTQFKRG